MQGLAWLLPVLDGPEDQRAVQGFDIDPFIAGPALPAIETDDFAQQQAGNHPGEKNQMMLVRQRTVLAEQGD